MADDDDAPTALELPAVFTPKQLAEHTGWSERKLREMAREIGACHIVGNRMLFTQADIDAILEASRPRPTRPEYHALQRNLVGLPVGGYEEVKKMLEARARKSSKARKGTA